MQDAGALNGKDWEAIPSSEYRGQFFDKEVPTTRVVQPQRGASQLMPTGPLDASTTYGGDYKQFGAARPETVRPSNAMSGEKLPFEGTSNYRSNFGPKTVPYSRHRPQTSFEPNRAKFEDSTTHNAAYQAYKMVPAFRGGPPVTSLRGESLPFDGRSTYAGDFVKKANMREVAKRPVSETIQTGPFDGATTYRVDFIEKEIPQRREQDCVECSCSEDEDC